MSIVTELKKHLEAMSAGASTGVHTISDGLKKLQKVTADQQGDDLDITIAAESGVTTVFGHTVSDLQSNIAIANGAVTGTLEYVATGALATDWGPGYFLVLKFSGLDQSVTSVKVGLDPSVSSGLVELIGDPDMNGVFKITKKDKQKFVARVRNANYTKEHRLDLSGLTLATPSTT